MILDGYEHAIYLRLNADSALTTLLTGGVFEYRALGISGIAFTNIIDARREPSTGIFKPFGVVRGRNVISTSMRLHDEDAQYTSVEQTIEVWVLDDATNTKTTIDAATDLVYTLLQFRPPTGAFQCEYVYHFDNRDYDFAGARVMCVEFLVTGQLNSS